MSDVKPKRSPREPARSPTAADAPTVSETVAEIVPEAPAANEAVSALPVVLVEPAPQIAPPEAAPPADSGDDSWRAVAEAQAVLARGFEEIAVALTGMTRSGIALAADPGGALLGADPRRSRRDQHWPRPAQRRCDDRSFGQTIGNRRQGGQRGVAADPVAARRELERRRRGLTRPLSRRRSSAWRGTRGCGGR